MSTILVDPKAIAALREAAAHQQRPRRYIRPFRVVTPVGRLRYTMLDPDLNRRHRSAARMAAAAFNPWVFFRHFVLPVVLVTAIGWATSTGIMNLFDREFSARGLVIGLITGLMAAVSVAFIVAQWQQGKALERHTRTVSGDHAKAMRAIEKACRVARKQDKSLPAVEMLWDVQWDEALAVRTARSLAALDSDEYGRVLSHLKRRPGVDLGPGNVTMLGQIVRPD